MGGENVGEEKGSARDYEDDKYFNDDRELPDSTRPPVGTQADPVLPGVPAADDVEAFEPPRVEQGGRADER